MKQLTVPDVLPAALAYINRFENNVTWGSLHLFQDTNFEDTNIQWCLEHAREVGDKEGETLARQILQLSQTQRRKLYRQMDTGWKLL